MHTQSYLIGLLLCSSLSTFANTAENVAKVKKFAAENGVEVSIGNNSQANRAGKRFVIEYNIGMELDLVSQGATLGYFFSQNGVIGLAYSRLKNDSDSTYSTITSNTLQLTYKAYLGNSFYVDAGLFYMNTKYDSKSLYRFGLEESDTNYRSKDLGAQIRIGNQWQWDNFTFGVDWIGVGHTGVNITKEGERPLYDELDGTYITLLNFQAGVSF